MCAANLERRLATSSSSPSQEAPGGRVLTSQSGSRASMEVSGSGGGRSQSASAKRKKKKNAAKQNSVITSSNSVASAGVGSVGPITA